MREVVKPVIGLVVLAVVCLAWVCFTFYRDTNRADNFCDNYPQMCHYNYQLEADNGQ